MSTPLRDAELPTEPDPRLIAYAPEVPPLIPGWMASLVALLIALFIAVVVVEFMR